MLHIHHLQPFEILYFLLSHDLYQPLWKKLQTKERNKPKPSQSFCTFFSKSDRLPRLPMKNLSDLL